MTPNEYLTQALQVIRKHDGASITLFQRSLGCGYKEAKRLHDHYRESGLLGEANENGFSQQLAKV